MVNLRNKLNHTINQLDSLLDYTGISPKTADLKQEYPYLINLEKLLGKELSTILNRLDEVQEDLNTTIITIENSTGDDKQDSLNDYKHLLKEARVLINRINDMLTQIDAPYFGAVDFKRVRNGEFPEAQIYAHIGKFSFLDSKTLTSLVTDWRAPIANLYYNNSGPTKNVEFTSPLGVQSGDLIKKIQYDISGGRISSIYDAKTGNSSADAFLLSQLNKKIGKKLSDIVSTIQDQQNQIIREKTDKPVIIQGVAGSGKTTILLHRIAYLLYSRHKEISPKNSLIIAPNKMFLDYISDVLPSLGVHDIGKNTYLYWAKTILGWDDKYSLNAAPDNLKVKEFKGSAEFIALVNDYIDDFVNDLLTKIPDKAAPQIFARYAELKQKSSLLSIVERIELAVDYAFAQKQFKYHMTGNFMGNLEDYDLRSRKIKAYIRRRTNVYSLYKELFKLAYIFKDRDISPELIAQLRQFSLKMLVTQKRINYYKAEDLAPAVFMHFKLNGYKEYLKDYIAVDEAQDLSLFQLLTLYATAKNSNITIAGDLAQSIIPPFYIRDWNDVSALYDNKVYYHQLEKCYRTTVEIIEYANALFRKHFPKSYKLPEAVLRHGEPVKTITFDKPIYLQTAKELGKLVELINAEFDKGAVTCALVCHDFAQADKVLEKIRKVEKKIKRPVFAYNEENYHEGLLILPVERAKGLEFDTVMIADLDSENYKKNTLDIRLLYVAMTRALHRLYILENKEFGKSELFD